MRANNRIRILVENQPEEWVIEGVFWPEIEAAEAYVSRCWEPSSMMQVADLSLLQHPERPLALVINARDRTELDMDRNILGPIYRRLSDTPSDDWIVAVAYPSIIAWPRSDPRVDAIYRDENLTNLHDQAVRFSEWSKSNTFDRAALAAMDPQFSALAEFVAAHTAAVTS